MLLNAHLIPLAETEDDVFALSQTFALPKINYVEIAMQEQLPHIFSRWPLVAELAQDRDRAGQLPLANGNATPRG